MDQNPCETSHFLAIGVLTQRCSTSMNPYLEQAELWQDFHLEFLPAMRRQLVPQVGPDYIIKLEEHLYIHDLPPEPRIGAAISRWLDRRLGRAKRPASSPASLKHRLAWKRRSRTSNGFPSWRSGIVSVAS